MFRWFTFIYCDLIGSKGKIWAKLFTWIYGDNEDVSEMVSVQVQMLENNVTINVTYLRLNAIFVS
jgi:hypothetical protein